ncbi:MAG: hypothetical protein SNJ78_02340 [Spirochaetales bacterium]
MNTASEAAQILIALIPIVGILMGGVVVFFFLLWNYKKSELLIRQGYVPPKIFDLDTFSLLAGLLNLSIGLVLTLYFLLRGGISPSLLGGLIPLAIGLSLTLFYLLRTRANRR